MANENQNSITGDKILDIKLRYNYTEEEIEFLRDHPLVADKTWQEKLNDPEIKRLIEFRRRQERLKDKAETEIEKKKENPFED